MRALLLPATIMAFAAGCSGDGDPAPTATPPQIGVEVSRSMPAAQAFAFGVASYQDAYVLHVETGEVRAIHRSDENAVGVIQWISDDKLVTHNGYAVTLDGDVSLDPRALPSATPSVLADVPASVDGLWSVERNLAISGITLTERATGRRFDLPDTDTYQWAPAGHLMATGGGWCGGGRVSIIDPDAGSIIPVTPGGPDGHGVMYVWRPDGRALALDLLGMSHSLVLVDPITGEMTPLIAPPENVGEFVPLAWNPRGTHLLLRVQGGRDCSD